MQPPPTAVVLALLALLSLTTGCQQAAGFGDSHDHLPHADQAQRLQSLACDTPALQEARAQNTQFAPRWYDARNDARLTVQAGYRQTTYEMEYTWSYDRQSQYGGRVYDSFHQTTRRQRIAHTQR